MSEEIQGLDLLDVETEEPQEEPQEAQVEKDGHQHCVECPCGFYAGSNASPKMVVELYAGHDCLYKSKTIAKRSNGLPTWAVVVAVNIGIILAIVLYKVGVKI